ncbi:MAG: carbohydrate kinase [Saprospiraceae bacterium]|nr:carbohydrate kinase [Saprospiraceae bacterium]
MYTIGLDVGSSSVKCSIFDPQTMKVHASSRFPEQEMYINAPRPGWAEQDPSDWWRYSLEAMRLAMSQSGVSGSQISAIGISYQMHGLVTINESGDIVRPAIIWCDSRAIACGREIASRLQEDAVVNRLYNTPGNFTASKLLWVKQNEPDLFKRIHQAMLPGDYIAWKMTGEFSTTFTGLSEAVLYDFSTGLPSVELMAAAGLDPQIFPKPVSSFSNQLVTHSGMKDLLGIPAGIPVSYRAGDQPNHAWAMGIISPGEAAATAGTSGVIYAVTDQVFASPDAGFNTFAHVNHHITAPRLGNLLCINGTGILYSWIRKNVFDGAMYSSLNSLAETCVEGADGVRIIPFGNGAERMLSLTTPGMSVHGVDLNRHGQIHILRAALEGIAFAFCLGMEKMADADIHVKSIRAGNDNLFQSTVFTSVIQAVSGVQVSVCDSNGAVGAAAGAAVGAGIISAEEWAASVRATPQPKPSTDYGKIHQAYQDWKNILFQQLKHL